MANRPWEKPDIVLDVERYNLWYVPEMPMDVPMCRARDGDTPWRVRLMESIRDEGMRHPILVYGHSPKGVFRLEQWPEINKDREKWLYIQVGTNRYWAAQQLGWEYFPAILSMNKGETPRWEATQISPQEFRDFAPEGRIYVQEHAFGWELTPKGVPSNEFG